MLTTLVGNPVITQKRSRKGRRVEFRQPRNGGRREVQPFWKIDGSAAETGDEVSGRRRISCSGSDVLLQGQQQASPSPSSRSPAEAQ